MTAFALYQSLMPNGKYRLDREIVYLSRYGKTVTVPAGYVSDGATGPGIPDLTSRAWYVHDRLCDTGEFDDGTPVTNWQCSTILHDILKEEGRWFRAKSWGVFTWLFGGGEARANGMF